jgi:hypothetical protein
MVNLAASLKSHAKSSARYKWIAPLALLIILLSADLYFVLHNIPPLSSSDDKMKAISTLFTFNSVILAGIGIMYQVQSTQEREIKFRIHEQRRDFCNQFLEYLENFFAAVKRRRRTPMQASGYSNK